MAIYSAGGKLLLSDDGESLRGCCCEECALVTVSVDISSYSLQPGSGGSGAHVLNSTMQVCSAFASASGSTLDDLIMDDAEQSCNPSPPCGEALATARCHYGTAFAIVPFKRGAARTKVASGYFNSWKVNVGTSTNYIDWGVEVEFKSQSGGAPTAQTMKPLVEIVFTNGVSKSTNGSDATWSNAFRTEAQPGGTMGRVDWDIYFT